jgi:hypothetical protein
MQKKIMFASLFIIPAFLNANDIGFEERAAKFKVTHKEASEVVSQLKKNNLKYTRPTTDKIYVRDGGTSEIEFKEDYIADNCAPDEIQFNNIQKTVLNNWIKSWKNKNEKDFNKLLVSSPKILKLNTGKEKGTENLGDINFLNWSDLQGTSSVKKYLSSFKIIEDFDLVTMKYVSPKTSRNSKMDMVKAELHIRLDVRGIDIDGKRRNDRGPVKVTVVKQNKSWKIAEIKNWGIETLTKKTATFSDVTKLAGLDKIKQYNRVEAIRRGGYSVSVGDFNNDNIQDIYLGSFGPGQLLEGQKNGKYKLVKNSGLEKDTYVKTSVFADFNNDGFQDLLLVRFVPTAKYKRRNDLIVYKNTGKGSFVRVEGVKDRSPTDYAMPAAVADFNNDKFLDFYVGFPGAKDFTTFANVEHKEGVKAQGVYFNNKNFSFVENGLGGYAQHNYKTFSQLQKLFPHSSVSLDIDQDGDMDIVVIDDQGNLSPAYINDGTGKFVQGVENIGVKNRGKGMGVASTDIDNDGILDVAISNVNFTTTYRTDRSCLANWNSTLFSSNDHGLKFFKGVQKGSFSDATGTSGLDYAGEGLAGVEFIDYNNDGLEDLYVANGLWSGTDKESDLGFLYSFSKIDADSRLLMRPLGSTQSVIMSILSGFQGDLQKNIKTGKRPHLAGFQRNRLFRNRGNGKFVEVGYLEGVDSIADGYVIAKADYDNDGDLDIILRNADPGSDDVRFHALQIFKNNSQGNHLRLKLQATSSNRDAIGASVDVKVNGKKFFKQLIANNGTAQSEKIIHFGLGTSKVADEVLITWPNGKKQILRNLKSGTHKIIENSNIAKR